MGSVFVTRSRNPEPHEVEGHTPLVTIGFGGTYFFLYPEILRLRDKTGELIDPQQNAYFTGDLLDDLAAFLASSHALASAQPTAWQQRVATMTSTGVVVYETTSRSDVLRFLASLTAAVELARERNMGVVFLGE